MNFTLFSNSTIPTIIKPIIDEIMMKIGEYRSEIIP